MKFLCDEMLKRLGRWLRAAGYDTLIQESGGSDRTMLQIAQREGRLVITRDRKLLEFRHVRGSIVVLRSNSMPDCIAELSQRVPLNWLYRPFTRCLVCNTILVAADSAAAWSQVPEASRAHVEQLFSCPTCPRVYWKGSHVRRMRARLNDWQVPS